MKKSAVLTGILVLLVLVLPAQEYTIATYNIRYDSPSDTGNEWRNRRPVIADLISYHDFDIFGIQEALYHQLRGLDSLLTGYTFVGVGRDDSIHGGEHAAIFFKTDMFRVMRKGDFWLSLTPEKPGPGWDAKINRICSWVRLQNKKTKKEFYVFNAHFDHQGVVARNESSKLILRRIAAIGGKSPVIFMGDLNTTQHQESYLTIARSGVLRDAYGLVKRPYELNGTFNSFNLRQRSTDRIDHIFLSSHFSATKWGVLTDSYGGKYPSDHFPVLAQVRLR